MISRNRTIFIKAHYFMQSKLLFFLPMRFCHSIGAKMIRYKGNCGIKAKTLKLKDFLN